MYAAYKAEKEKKLAEERKKQEEEDEIRRREEEKEKRKEQKKSRKMVNRYKDRTGEAADTESDSNAPPPPAVETSFHQPANALQVWTDSDLAKLARLMKKFPAGTPG